MTTTNPATPRAKQIRLWKVLVFGTISCSVYSLVWLAKRARELRPTDSPASVWSHWLVPVILLILIIPAVFIGMTSALFVEPIETAFVMSFVLPLLLSLPLTVGIIWWIVALARQIDRRLGMKTPLAALIVLAFFFPPLLTAHLQRRINQPKADSLLAVFVVLSIVIGVGMITYSIISELTDPTWQTDFTSLYHEVRTSLDEAGQ